MLKKEILGWTLYDLADTAFSALFITFFYPVFIKVYLGGNEFHIGLAMGLSLFLSAIFVPFIGAWSDALGKRKPFIFLFTTLCVAATVMVAFSNLFWALVLGLLASFFYHAALDVYDALLITISTQKTIGKISGLGVAFGYLGTILSLGMAFIILSLLGWENKLSIQTILIATGLFYFVFSLFLFAWTPEHLPGRKVALGRGARQAFHSLMDSFKKVKKNASVWFFLLASLLYTDGMNTAIIFLYLYGREQLGVTVQQFLPIFAVMAVGAGLGALLFGKVADALTPRKTLLILVGVWICVILVLLFKTTFVTYIASGIIGGAALGGIWAVTRPMLLSLVAKEKAAEYLGFQGLTEKLSGVFGPIVFGWLVVHSGYTAALLSVIVFFIFGFGILLRVPDKI